MKILHRNNKFAIDSVKIISILKTASIRCTCKYTKPCGGDNPHLAPTVQLFNGKHIPQIGLGTWGSLPGKVEAAVKHAISIGYRHIDCAHVYQNEKEVGNAIRAKILDGTVKREDLWITSKLWCTFHRPDLVRGACQHSLRQLDLDYLDLYLIHWPTALYEGTGSLLPRNACGKIKYSTVHYIDTWREMEKLQKTGLCKSIGLSNFNKRQILDILKYAKVRPVVNQIECHPYLCQEPLRAFCKSRKIAIIAYSPLGAPGRPNAKPGDPVLMEEDKVKKIALRRKKAAAQILLRFQIELENIAIPKSVTKERIESNFHIFDFKLNHMEYEILTTLNRNHRFVAQEELGTHPHHPFIYDLY